MQQINKPLLSMKHNVATGSHLTTNVMPSCLRSPTHCTVTKAKRQPFNVITWLHRFWHLGITVKINETASGSAGQVRSKTGKDSLGFCVQNLPRILSSGSVSHILGSQAWNQPAKVGGSTPCLMVVMGSPLRPDGSESTYSFAAWQEVDRGRGRKRERKSEHVQI